MAVVKIVTSSPWKVLALVGPNYATRNAERKFWLLWQLGLLLLSRAAILPIGIVPIDSTQICSFMLVFKAIALITHAFLHLCTNWSYHTLSCVGE